MKNYNVTEFVAGQTACRNGKDCPSDASESFKAGFCAQYELEQQQEYLTRGAP
jgi:hypothetical protein